MNAQAAAQADAMVPWLSVAPGLFTAAAFGFMVIRYLVLGVLPYLYLYQGAGSARFLTPERQLNRTLPTDRQNVFELIHSLKSLLLFTLGSLYVYAGIKMGWVEVYAKISDKGWGYYFLTLLAMLVIQDTWFYFTHRLFHARAFFRWAHLQHHSSVSTSPLSAFSFNAVEALTHASIAVVAYGWFPVHPSTFFIFQLMMALQNLNAHCGVDWTPRLLKRWGVDRALGTILVGSRTHHRHHQRGDGNFGLYFRIWDRLLGTNLETVARPELKLVRS